MFSKIGWLDVKHCMYIHMYIHGKHSYFLPLWPSRLTMVLWCCHLHIFQEIFYFIKKSCTVTKKNRKGVVSSKLKYLTTVLWRGGSERSAVPQHCRKFKNSLFSWFLAFLWIQFIYYYTKLSSEKINKFTYIYSKISWWL